MNIIRFAVLVVLLLAAMAGNSFSQPAGGESKVSGDVVPGMGYWRMDFFDFQKSKPYILIAYGQAEGVEIFCIRKDRQLACYQIEERIMFTFFPMNGSSRQFVRAIGFSSDQAKYPAGEYRLFREE